MGRGLISKDVIDRIRDRVDIVESSDTMSLRRLGKACRARARFIKIRPLRFRQPF